MALNWNFVNAKLHWARTDGGDQLVVHAVEDLAKARTTWAWTLFANDINRPMHETGNFPSADAAKASAEQSFSS